MTGKVAVMLVFALVSTARADDLAEARAYYKKGLSAYALGDYAEAARSYERAFALQPESAILYNAAQAHRAAGNNQRALLLYQNYLRAFGDQVPNREEVQRLIATLKESIDDRPATAPVLEIARPSPAPAVASAAITQPPLAEKAPQPRRKTKGWVIGVAVAGAALAVLGVGLGVGLGLPRDPTPTLGQAAVR